MTFESYFIVRIDLFPGSVFSGQRIERSGSPFDLGQSTGGCSGVTTARMFLEKVFQSGAAAVDRRCSSRCLRSSFHARAERFLSAAWPGLTTDCLDVELQTPATQRYCFCPATATAVRQPWSQCLGTLSYSETYEHRKIPVASRGCVRPASLRVPNYA